MRAGSALPRAPAPGRRLPPVSARALAAVRQWMGQAGCAGEPAPPPPRARRQPRARPLPPPSAPGAPQPAGPLPPPLLPPARRSRPAHSHALRSADRGQLLDCYLAGLVQPTPAGMQYLRALPRQRLHQARLVGVVNRCDQGWTTAPQEQHASSGSSGGAAHAAAATVLPPPWWRRLLLQWHGGGWGGGEAPAVAPPLRAQDSSGGGRGGGGGGAADGQLVPAAQPEPQARDEWQRQPDMLFAELRAYPPPAARLLGPLLPPLRRVDVAQELLSRGDAAMMEAIDQEWIGVSWRRLDALYAAEQAAIAQRLGRWASRRPALGEWSRSLARSAWMRVRRVVRAGASTGVAVASAAQGALGSAIRSGGAEGMAWPEAAPAKAASCAGGAGAGSSAGGRDAVAHPAAPPQLPASHPVTAVRAGGARKPLPLLPPPLSPAAGGGSHSIVGEAAEAASAAGAAKQALERAGGGAGGGGAGAWQRLWQRGTL